MNKHFSLKQGLLGKTAKRCSSPLVRGFTLIELLIYVSIFAVASGLLTTILVTTTRVENAEIVSTQVGQELNLVLTTVQRLVRDASLIECVGANQSACSTSAVPGPFLKLRFEESAQDPTCIYLENNIVKLAQGPDPLNKQNCNLASAENLTTDKVNNPDPSLANSLTFTKFDIPGGHATVQIDAQLSYNSVNPQLQVSKTLRSAVGRVSAATFDSDLFPDSTAANRSIGDPAKSWKNLFLTGLLKLGTFTDPDPTNIGTGSLYYNTTLGNKRLRVYDGTDWQNVGSQTPWTQNINAAGFTLFGNSTASGNLTLDSTSDATKGYIILNPTGGNVGIGIMVPVADLHISATDPEIRLTDTGDSEYTRITRADTSKKAVRYNRTTKPGSVYAISNLVAQWKMNDNAANTTVAELGGLYNGVLNVNTDTRTVAGKIDTALSFNGSTDFVEVTDPNIGTANTFTACLWIYPTDTAYRNIISYGNDSANRGWTIKGSGNGNISLRNALGQTVTSVTTAPVNQWTFICVQIRTGWSDLNIYINGVLDNQNHGGDTIAPNSTDDFRIGKVWDADQSGSVNYFLGRIDDVRYYNKVLSDTDISKIYNNGNGTDEQGLNAASVVETDVWSSQDGVLASEEGIQTYGHGLGRTVIDGKTIRFNIGSSEKANIDASGNLGIGTASPSGNLDVQSTHAANVGGINFIAGNTVIANSNPLIYSYKVGASGGAVSILGFNNYVDAAGYTSQRINTNLNGWAFVHQARGGAGTNGYLSIDEVTAAGVEAASRVTFQAGGNVGIGTETPDSRLHILGILQMETTGLNNREFRYKITGGGANYDTLYTQANTVSGGATFADLMAVNADGNVGVGYDASLATGKLTINGNVGIGTMVPTSKLQVVGLPIYANNAAAVTGGLTVGAFYRTGADPDPVMVVH